MDDGLSHRFGERGPESGDVFEIVMTFMCDWKDSVEARMTSRLRASMDRGIVQLSTSRRRSPTFWSSTLEDTTMSSVLLVFSLSRFDVIQSFIS